MSINRTLPMPEKAAFDFLAAAEAPAAELPRPVEPEQKESPQPELIASGPFAGLPLLPTSSILSSLPYVFCNETGKEETLDFLMAQHKPCDNTVHIGFALWFNFDIISVTRPSLAMICDIDNYVSDAFKIISDCLKRSSTRREFVQNFKENISPFLKRVYALSTDEDLSRMCNVEEECSREKSWLSSDSQFHTIKALDAEGKILFQNLDMTDSSGKFSAITDWMKRRDLKTSTLYASNILEWVSHLSQGRQQRAIMNLTTLVDEKTFFIQAYSPSESDKRVGPRQHVTQGPTDIKMPEAFQSKGVGAPQQAPSRLLQARSKRALSRLQGGFFS